MFLFFQKYFVICSPVKLFIYFLNVNPIFFIIIYLFILLCIIIILFFRMMKVMIIFWQWLVILNIHHSTLLLGKTFLDLFFRLKNWIVWLAFDVFMYSLIILWSMHEDGEIYLSLIVLMSCFIYLCFCFVK